MKFDTHKKKLIEIITIYVVIILLFVITMIFMFPKRRLFASIIGLIIGVIVCVILFFTFGRKILADAKEYDDKWNGICSDPFSEENLWLKDDVITKCFDGNKKEYEEYLEANQNGGDDL
jgi:hypothetical protein